MKKTLFRALSAIVLAVGGSALTARAFEMPSDQINMPLGKEDFVDGAKHYFLVGSRLGQFRLQPEWELQPREDGTVGLDNRLLTSGFFAVAVVDNYTDYTRHLFRLYGPKEDWGDWVTKTFWVKDLPGKDEELPDVNANNDRTPWYKSAKAVPLQAFADGQFRGETAEGLYSGIRFGNNVYSTESGLYKDDLTHFQFGDNNVQLHDGAPKKAFNFVTPKLTNPNENADPNNQEGRENNGPALVGKIRVALDNDGIPTLITLSEVSKDMNVIDNYRTISFVGGGFRNVSNDPDKTYYRSPRAHFYTEEQISQEIERQKNNDQSANYQIYGFADGWIQYDRQGRPYVDAYGEFLYHTCYQRDWLTPNFSYMKNESGFEYTSDNLVFTYDEARTNERKASGKYTFGQAENNEIVYYYEDGNKHDQTRDLGADLKCFTVENVWINGSFNLWTGFGGNTLDYIVAAREDAARNDAHWNIDNGSTHTQEQDRVVYALGGVDGRDRGDIYFATFENWKEGRFAAGVKGNANGIAQVNGADKTVLGLNDGVPEFFDRVEIWWKPGYEDGHRFKGGAVVRFVQTPGGPNIWISRLAGNTLGYNYNIPESGRTAVNPPVIEWYKIERIAIKYNEDGTEDLTNAAEVENVTYAVGEQPKQDEFYAYLEREMFRQDQAYIQPGDYRYRITIRYNGDTHEYPALSNKVTVTPHNLYILYSHLKGTYQQGRYDAGGHTLQINAELFDDNGQLVVDKDQAQYVYTVTKPDGTKITSSPTVAPYWEIQPQAGETGWWHIEVRAHYNDTEYLEVDDYPVFDGSGNLPGSDLTVADQYYMVAFVKSGAKTLTSSLHSNIMEQPVYGWTKYEYYQYYVNEKNNCAAGKRPQVEYSDNPNEPLATRNLTVDNNNTNSHNCCNFQDAYYRIYASHPGAAPEAKTMAPRRARAHVSASDVTATRVARTIEMKDNTTGIEDVTEDVNGDANATAEYYNLQGIRIAEPQAGETVIVRRGTTVSKQIYR